MPVPGDSHIWLIRCIKAIKLYSNEGGICDGFISALIPRVFLMEVDAMVWDKFNQLLLDLYRVYRLIYPNDEIPFKEDQFAPAFRKKINEGISTLKFLHETKPANITPAEKNLIKRFDMQVFMEQVDLLFHDKAKYPEIYYPALSDSGIRQHNLNIILPNKIDPISEVANVILAYQSEQTISPLHSLEALLIKNNKRPIALSLRSVNHTLLLAYYPLARLWIFADCNAFPAVKTLRTIDEVIDHVKIGFFNETCMTFQVLIYASKNAAIIKENLKPWQPQYDDQMLHTSPISSVVDSAIYKLLLLAIRNSNFPLVKSLLKTGMHPDQLSLTPAFTIINMALTAAGTGRKAILIELMCRGANPNGFIKGSSHLVNAICWKAEESIKCLLKYRADPNLKSLEGCTALHVAAEREPISMLKLLLSDSRTDLVPTLKKRTPLMLAQDHDYDEAVILISKAQVNRITQFKEKIPIPTYPKALSQLKQLATQTKSEAERLKLDHFFCCFMTLFKLYRFFDLGLKEKSKPQFTQAFGFLSQKKISLAEEIIISLQLIHYKIQLNQLSYQISRIPFSPSHSVERVKAIKHLSEIKKKAENDLNEISILHLRLAYEAFVEIDQHVFQPRTTFFLKEFSNDFSKKLYKDFVSIQDGSYTLLSKNHVLKPSRCQV